MEARHVRRTVLVGTALVLLLLAACAPGANDAITSEPGAAGFWLGLWHGIIAPVTFVVSLFTDTVNVYEVRNTGNGYDAGFMLGLLVALGGPARGAGASARAPRRAPRDRRGVGR
ncbi:hypothetical protein [Actinotalea solisilvae]|uniref:hypothetical protein n=1 Tax=Actinotalea solisilvae TaxID=2072922 RepID=UPI0018F1A4F9|nr:hypothetical protein [Actinotalea solisilvae]